MKPHVGKPDVKKNSQLHSKATQTFIYVVLNPVIQLWNLNKYKFS